MTAFFECLKTSSKARAGVLNTSHGVVQTPVFMPVGTQGTVKALSFEEIERIDFSIILANTYHLYLRPGTDLLKSFGGFHNFTSWNGALLTDSGGFQIYSLSKLRKITDEGYSFSSHIDGSKHFFSPEKALEVQKIIGADIVMPLDECLAFSEENSAVKKSVDRTLLWAKRSRDYLSNPGSQHLFGIVQGSGVMDERVRCAENLVKIGFDGYSIGGLSVGEKKSDMYALTELCCNTLPQSHPRYLMGVGAPEDLVEGVARGVDMFDCVLPTRNARNATVYTFDGKMLMRNLENAGLDEPMDKECGCIACKRYSRGYIRHLFKAGEMTAAVLATAHNLFFFKKLMSEMRTAILNDVFENWRTDFYKRYKV